MKPSDELSMKILGVEFSSEQRSVALVEKLPGEKPQLRGAASEKGGRAAHAFALMEQTLNDAGIQREEIDAIAVGLGPGSYTGIRAAIALAQGWQIARAIKLIGISSVECLAAQSFNNGIRGRANFIVDAQRNEFYLAAYEIGEHGASEAEPLRIATFEEVERLVMEKQFLAGPGAAIPFPGAEEMFPDAAMLAQLACAKTETVCGEALEPIYLREINFVKAPPPRVI
jgi:tRNA threonylcarbamoyladenosine biosynthesis protein TsaB